MFSRRRYPSSRNGPLETEEILPSQDPAFRENGPPCKDRYLVDLVYLAYLVCLVDLVDLVDLAENVELVEETNS